MWTLKNEEFLGFDDRWFAIIGTVIVSCITHPLLFDVRIIDFIQSPVDILISFLWTGTYWMVLRKVMVYLRKKYPLISQTPRRLSICTMVILLIAPVISFFLSEVCNRIFYYSLMTDVVKKYVIIYLLVMGIFAVYEAIFYFYQYRKAIEETERLKTVQIKSQLDNLKNQISPHFLFNSLNTLMNLIPKDQDRAMTYLSKLSQFYRYTVSNQEESLVPVETELENALTFADLLRERFGNNINIQIECADYHHRRILPLTLQLLIENAVKHNIVSKSKPLQVKVHCSDDEYLHVTNTYQPKIQAVTSTGVGLDNIRKRVTYFTDKKVVVEQTDSTFIVSVPLIDPV